jgi:hypothetical protein
LENFIKTTISKKWIFFEIFWNFSFLYFK